jgi:hypothetical protein
LCIIHAYLADNNSGLKSYPAKEGLTGSCAFTWAFPYF